MMSSLSLHAASLSTNNTGLELLHLVSEIYKTQLHWGTKCGHGWCTNMAAFCAQNTAVWVHKTQLCWCINSSCVGVQNMAVLVYKNSRIGEQNAAIVCAPTRQHSVHKMRPCWCIKLGRVGVQNTAAFCTPMQLWFVHQHGRILYPNAAVICTPIRPSFMHQHGRVLCMECGRVGAQTTAECSARKWPIFVQ